jgi:hypothetical protein
MSRDTHHDLDTRLAAATPVRAADVPRIPRVLVDAAVMEIVSSGSPTSRPARRGRRRRVLVAALVALVVVPATAAALDVAGIHTGIFPGRESTELTPGEELLNISSPDIVPVVRKLTRSIPLPEGASWLPFLERYPATEPTLAQRIGIGAEAEWFARCRWMGTWLQAYRDDDASGRRRSAAMLAQAATWRYTRAVGGDGVAVFERDAAAARRGDPGPVRQTYRANCT